ncbi:MAG: hypothetical protein JWM93_288 [Frankiales bacterium]|nr:hypothetical protein [Frankiales bacterium]
MSRSFRPVATRAGAMPRWSAAVAASTVAAVALSLAVPAAASAVAPAVVPAGVETRAALAPSLVAGRGADVAFAEQEAENAVTTGTVIGPDRTAYTLPAEASGRKAVKLSTAGQYVEFTLTRDTNAINVRYSLPDAPNGGGITAPLAVSVNGKLDRTMTLTSQYSWLYNQYQFTNDPNAGPIHPDWWIVERDGYPASSLAAPFRPMHFYDEARLVLNKKYRAGDKLRLTVPAGSTASSTVIDLIDTENVAGPQRPNLFDVNVLLFGADPSGRRDSADAIDRAIAFAKRLHLKVYIPAGTFKVNRHIIVDDVTVKGAGNWWTILKGSEVALATPAPDGSVHTGVGFYGKDSSVGGSTNVHLSGFAIEGDVRSRIDTDQVNGIGGAMSNSTIDGLYIHHTKVGMWFDGPMTNTQITNNIVVDVIADGINFRRGVTNSTVSNNFFRNTGDDGMAMWSDIDADTNDVFDHNTVQTPTLANGIAIYGGTDNTVSNNLVADPIREGSGLHAGSRFGATMFTGYLHFTNNTTVRAGTFELNWKIGLGAIWFLALEKDINADIRVTGDHYLDSTYNAIMFVADWPVKDTYSITNVHFKDVHVDGAGTSVVSARAAGSASFENVDVRNIGWWGVNNCGTFHWDWANGSEFSLINGGGNDGFDTTPWRGTTGHWFYPYAPNTLLCEDRPPVTAPPAPSAW